MNIKITSKNIQVTDAMKEAIENKLSSLEQFIGTEQIKVSISSRKKDFKICILTIYDGKLIKIEKTDYDFYNLVSSIGDILKDKLEKMHTKKIKKLKDQENALHKLNYDSETEEKEFMNQEIISKKKKISLVPMMPEEAISEMEKLGHESFLFLNMETEKPCMIYSRFDGTFGLIETE